MYHIVNQGTISFLGTLYSYSIGFFFFTLRNQSGKQHRVAESEEVITSFGAKLDKRNNESAWNYLFCCKHVILYQVRKTRRETARKRRSQSSENAYYVFFMIDKNHCFPDIVNLRTK